MTDFKVIVGVITGGVSIAVTTVAFQIVAIFTFAWKFLAAQEQHVLKKVGQASPIFRVVVRSDPGNQAG